MKDRIINESISCLRDKGLKFSIDNLAEKLKISKKTIYKYFNNKEELAIAIYFKYYSQILVEANKLVQENSETSHYKLINIYYDAKLMTRKDIFNKYKLNESLYSYTSQQNDNLWEIIASSIKNELSVQNKEATKLIVNGSFEKLCNERIAPSSVIERIVSLLW